jgi:hypothetical protein
MQPQTKTIGLTLSECVDQYLALRQVDKKKYYAGYLIAAKWAWKELFWNTLWVTQSVWKPILSSGDIYNYIEIPKDCLRIFTINEVDDCGNLITVYYNSKLNTIPIPPPATGGLCCTNGVCQDVASFNYTTQWLFNIAGVDYYQKIWLKYCPNGTIIEYTETPVKKYNDFTGDGGDYMNDYNNDHLRIGAAFSDYTIVTQIEQKTLCVLQAKPCGCPVENDYNQQLLKETCGCHISPFGKKWAEKCAVESGNINDNWHGDVKIAPCGTKIYYRGSFHRKRKYPNHLLLLYQTNAENCGEQVIVPEYAVEAVFCGVDFRTKRFNNSFSLSEKKEAKYEWHDAQSNVIKFLSPINLEEISNVQDTPILF